MNRAHFLMCRPDHYTVNYVINPWMEGNINRPNEGKAAVEWDGFISGLREVAEVSVIQQADGLPDMVFSANGAFILNGVATVANYRHPQRQGEEPLYDDWLSQNGFRTVRIPRTIAFEGAGDALHDKTRRIIWAAWGFRSDLESHPLLAEIHQTRVASLHLVDERFYHLDTCFAPLDGGHVMYFPGAFDAASQRLIEEIVEPDKRIVVSLADALRFVCNAVEASGHLFVNDCSPELEAQIAATGLKVHRTYMSQFLMAGGANRCLTLRLNMAFDGVPPSGGVPIVAKEFNLSGHLLDHGMLTGAFDAVGEMGGSLEILEFKAGSRREDVSTARLRVSAPGETRLAAIVEKLLARGARTAEPVTSEAKLEIVDKDGVAPEEFFGSTIYQTDVRINGQWVRCEEQRMDAAIVVSRDALTGAPGAVCRLLRDLKVGEAVVVGHEGIRHVLPEEKKSDGESFKFMGASASSERRVELTIEQIAWDMTRIRARQGRIVVVAGPVVIHTGGVEALSELVRDGYVQSFLGGNAIAVHDLERDQFGTSLGVDASRGVPVEGGHRHHLKTINRIRRAGSIAAAVKAGLIRGGIMKTLVDRNVPFVLAGSIRDDGPLPDTVMDLTEAQRLYSEQLRGADMVLMLSSMLHSIGVGNMTPAGVKLICVDINPAVVTKLADRGSLESVGVVTDVGLFVKLLVQKIRLIGG